MSDGVGPAGLTPKPHRDLPADEDYVDRFACDWHRLAGGPHEEALTRARALPTGATTDPDGLHDQTLVQRINRRKWTALVRNRVSWRRADRAPPGRRHRGCPDRRHPGDLERTLRLPQRRSGGDDVVDEHDLEPRAG